MLPVFRIIGRKRRIEDRPSLLIPAIGEDRLLFLSPFLLRGQLPHRQHDVGMRIPVSLVMQGKVSDHPLVYKVLSDK